MNGKVVVDHEHVDNKVVNNGQFNTNRYFTDLLGRDGHYSMTPKEFGQALAKKEEVKSVDADRFIQSYDTALIEMNKKVRALQLLGNIRPLSYREQFDFKYLMILRTKYLELRRIEFEKVIDKINAIPFN